MGYGDQLMATGMARGAAARGKRIALGDGRTILWDHHLSEEVFKDNLNLAPPGSENAHDIEWVHFYRGNRGYNTHDPKNQRWLWNYDFKPTPGEVTLSSDEIKFASRFGKGFILVEPHTPTWKSHRNNKQWPIERYSALVQILVKNGYDVRQLSSPTLPGVKNIVTPTFRHAMAVLSQASLYVGAEGGLHHAAAALGIPGVVIFGGWVPPQVTGYDIHINLAHGEACGNFRPCAHCTDAMMQIKVKHVLNAVKEKLECGLPKLEKPLPELRLPSEAL